MSARRPLLLVPLSLDLSSDRAIEPAVALARGGSVVLFSWSYDEGEAAAAKQYLAERAAEVDGDVTIEVAHTADRSPAAVIARAADASGATVCMASDRAGRWGQSVMGSTGMEVLEATGRVILVGPRFDPITSTERSILVCLDGSATAEQVLPAAQAWARERAIPLRFVQVVPPGTPYPMSPDEADQRPWAYLCRMAVEVGGHDDAGGRVAVLYGDPAREIARHARRSSLVAMATSAHHGIDLALRRSTAMRVVHRSPCPVLLVRADR